MGGKGSGRKPNFKTELVMFALDVQIKTTSIIDNIRNKDASFEEVTNELISLNRTARRICEENERL